MKYKGLFDKRPLVLSVFITILLLMTDVILTGICSVFVRKHGCTCQKHRFTDLIAFSYPICYNVHGIKIFDTT